MDVRKRQVIVLKLYLIVAVLMSADLYLDLGLFDFGLGDGLFGESTH